MYKGSVAFSAGWVCLALTLTLTLCRRNSEHRISDRRNNALLPQGTLHPYSCFVAVHPCGQPTNDPAQQRADKNAGTGKTEANSVGYMDRGRLTGIPFDDSCPSSLRTSQSMCLEEANCVQFLWLPCIKAAEHTTDQHVRYN